MKRRKIRYRAVKPYDHVREFALPKLPPVKTEAPPSLAWMRRALREAQEGNLDRCLDAIYKARPYYDRANEDVREATRGAAILLVQYTHRWGGVQGKNIREVLWYEGFIDREMLGHVASFSDKRPWWKRVFG